MQVASHLDSSNLEEIYQNYRFGNIKHQDRSLYFPLSKVKPFNLPWQPARETKSWSSILKKDTVEVVGKTQAPIILQKKSRKEDWKNIPAASKEITIASRGLINNGNMCFMNAILQPLLFTVPFYIFLLGLSKRKLLDQENTPILDSVIKFVMEFNISPDPARDVAFSAEYVYDAIRMSTTMDSLRGRQEDAQEFLGFLLDGIHEELLKSIDKPSPAASPEIEGEWTQIGKKNKHISSQTTSVDSTQITRIFGGSWRSTLKSVGKESVTTEPFQIITLEISGNEIESLQDCLDSVSRPEVLEGHSSPTTKHLVFESCPPILILLLKRFVYDETRGALKLDKYISFPSQLEIKHSVSPNPPCYKLYAVVNHHGKFVQGGHYTADINHKNTWTRFDDHDVKSVAEDIVFGKQSDRQPYILFYRLV